MTMYDERLHTDERYGDPASGPRNTIPFEMSGGDMIPDDGLLKCPDFMMAFPKDDQCTVNEEACPYAGNEAKCADALEKQEGGDAA